MAMLTVDGHAISHDPATMQVSMQRVSASDAGRDQGGTMHVNQVTKKRKVALSWVVMHEADTVEVLQAFAPEYISVSYYDPFDGQMETRTFYTGDQTADMRSYQVPCVGGTTFKTVSFDIIEV